MARALDALGVDIIEAGFPIASPADSEAVAADRRARCAGRSIAALARCRPQDIEEAARALEPAERAAHPHVPRHLRPAPRRASCASRARRASSRPSTAVALRAAVHRRCGVFGGGRDAQRPRFPVPRRRGGRSTPARRPSTCRIRSATRRPTRPASSSPSIMRPRPERRPGGLQRALPRRPRAGRRQQPRGDPGRRAADRVHDQRHRRARRQRVARGDRDGAPRPAAIGCRTTPAIQSPALFDDEPAAVARSPASRCRRTRRSSAATRSRTRPASTRTAC